MEKGKKYWEFNAKATNEADLFLYIEIASWGGGYCAHSAQSFKAELDALGGIETLNIYINSPGGDVFEGNAIYNMLKRKARNCQVNVFVDALAASISSVIAMSGKYVGMPGNAMMMIHKSSLGCYGNADDLEKGIELLRKVDISMKQAYLDKSNGKLDEVILDAMLNSGDTWLTAQECFDYGLCDEILEEKQISAKYDDKVLKNYKNVPKAFSFDNKPITGLNLEDKSAENIKDDEIEVLIKRINNKFK
ncbi:head maturation protease, ClpP-related [Clostridium sp. FP1]|uniref:head maturation protease, ClpP-related n=1 Tax=Clostridium sp. FP1 TaxID=2724076 RepID=UPI0013E9660E|nr:head maturation protease, ClpP-related [Clostridium sp. FP1]MBZ9633183.1 Clp protease ClpP [Clostridium sp. FP1]